MKKLFEISCVSTVGEGFVEGEDAGVKWRVFGRGDRGKESPTFRNQLSHPPHRWLPYPAFTAPDYKGIFLLPLIPFLHNPSPLPALSRLLFPWVNIRIPPSLKDRLKRQKSFLGLVLVKWSAEKKKKKKIKDEVHISISLPKYYEHLMHDTGFVAYASLARFALKYLKLPFRPMAP